MSQWPQIVSAMMGRPGPQVNRPPVMPMQPMPHQMQAFGGSGNHGFVPPMPMKSPGFINDSGMAPPLPMAGKIGPVRRVDDSGMAPQLPMPVQGPQPTLPQQGPRNPFIYGR